MNNKPDKRNRIVGRVALAEWTEEEQGIDVILQFEPASAKLRGTIRSGPDPHTGRTVRAVDLRAKLPAIREMKVYWHPTKEHPRFDVERLSRLVIQLDLARLDLSVKDAGDTPDFNSYLSRLFR